MNDKQLIAEIRGISEAARCAEGAVDYDTFVLERLYRLVGFDVAFFLRDWKQSRVAPGFEDAVRRACRDRWPGFGRELDRFAREALARGGTGIDLSFFGAAGLARRAFYREIMRPHNGRSTLIGYIAHRGRVQATLVLGRKRGSPDFTDDDQAAVEALIPTLSLAELAVQIASPHGNGGARAALTPREHGVLEYLELGFSNAEIDWARTRARLDSAELALPLGPMTVPPPVSADQAEKPDAHEVAVAHGS